MRRYESVFDDLSFASGVQPLAEALAAARLPPDMPFEIRVSLAFSASHSLRLPDGTMEPPHNHGWSVDVTLAADVLDAMDCVVDFHLVEQQLAAITKGWDRKHLNDVQPFASGINPSAERVAEAIGRSLAFEDRVRLVRVEIGEATGCVAVYRP